MKSSSVLIPLFVSAASALPEPLRRRLHPFTPFQRSIASGEKTKVALFLSELSYGNHWKTNPELMKQSLEEFQEKAPRGQLLYASEEPTSHGTSFTVVVSPTRKELTVSFMGSISPTTRQGFKNWFKTNLLSWKAPLVSGGRLRKLPFVPLGDGNVGIHYGFKTTYEAKLGKHVGLRFRPDSEGAIKNPSGKGSFERDRDRRTPLEKKIFDLVDDYLEKEKEYKLIVTGHSLGGALATLFGTRYALAHADRKVRVITFGSPRVGNSGFRELTEYLPNLAINRIVNNEDIVARLPRAGYHHVGHTIVVGAGPDPHIMPWKTNSDSAETFGEWNGWKMLPRVFKAIGDHHTDKYIAATKEATKSPGWLKSIDKLDEKSEGTVDGVGDVDDFRLKLQNDTDLSIGADPDKTLRETLHEQLPYGVLMGFVGGAAGAYVAQKLNG